MQQGMGDHAPRWLLSFVVVGLGMVAGCGFAAVDDELLGPREVEHPQAGFDIEEDSEDYQLTVTPSYVELADGEGRRLTVRALDQRGSEIRVLATFDLLGAPGVALDTWVRAGTLQGRLSVGEEWVRWRVRLDGGGQLAGERWSRRRGSEPAGLGQARELVEQLERVAGEPEVSEVARLVMVSLELGGRTWTGAGRAELPELMASSDFTAA